LLPFGKRLSLNHSLSFWQKVLFVVFWAEKGNYPNWSHTHILDRFFFVIRLWLGGPAAVREIKMYRIWGANRDPPHHFGGYAKRPERFCRSGPGFRRKP